MRVLPKDTNIQSISKFRAQIKNSKLKALFPQIPSFTPSLPIWDLSQLGLKVPQAHRALLGQMDRWYRVPKGRRVMIHVFWVLINNNLKEEAASYPLSNSCLHTVRDGWFRDRLGLGTGISRTSKSVLH